MGEFSLVLVIKTKIEIFYKFCELNSVVNKY